MQNNESQSYNFKNIYSGVLHAAWSVVMKTCSFIASVTSVKMIVCIFIVFSVYYYSPGLYHVTVLVGLKEINKLNILVDVCDILDAQMNIRKKNNGNNVNDVTTEPMPEAKNGAGIEHNYNNENNKSSPSGNPENSNGMKTSSNFRESEYWRDIIGCKEFCNIIDDVGLPKCKNKYALNQKQIHENEAVHQ